MNDFLNIQNKPTKLVIALKIQPLNVIGLPNEALFQKNPSRPLVKAAKLTSGEMFVYLPVDLSHGKNNEKSVKGSRNPKY